MKKKAKSNEQGRGGSRQNPHDSVVDVRAASTPEGPRRNITLSSVSTLREFIEIDYNYLIGIFSY